MKLYATIKARKMGGQEVEKSQGSNEDMRIIVRDETGEWFLQIYISNDNGTIVADAETGDGEIKRLVEKQSNGKSQKGDRLGVCHCGYPCVYGTDYCERHQLP